MLLTAAIVFAAFALAGMVKGVAGLGLPTVSLALLTATVGLEQAVVLMLAPSFATNVWQALAGGALRTVLARTWPMLLVASVAIWLSAGAVERTEAAWLSGMLGVVLCVYAAVSLCAVRVPPPGRWEPWLTPLVGLCNGIVTGLTGSFAFPGVLYLQALDLPREIFVQAMGVLFTLSTVVLGAALAWHGQWPPGSGLLSTLALLPAFCGMWLGGRVRRRLSEDTFRRAFFTALLVIGAYLAIRAVGV